MKRLPKRWPLFLCQFWRGWGGFSGICVNQCVNQKLHWNLVPLPNKKRKNSRSSLFSTPSGARPSSFSSMERGYLWKLNIYLSPQPSRCEMTLTQRCKFIGKLLLYFSFIFYIFADDGIFFLHHAQKTKTMRTSNYAINRTCSVPYGALRGGYISL